jgi:hypothetical protein
MEQNQAEPLRFVIEQIAICPANPSLARALLADLGATDWANDHVVALGSVFGVNGENEADLSFNYELFGGKEFEVLSYTAGNNWMKHDGRANTVSHLGMHCSAADLLRWRAFFAERGIRVAQEVMTQSHTNPLIDGKRWYNYVIFDTKGILGVDLKFIVRLDAPGSTEPGPAPEQEVVTE